MPETLTVRKLARLVRDCRTAQKNDFSGRSTAALDRAKSLEQEVDRAVAAILDRQPSLFGEEARS